MIASPVLCADSSPTVCSVKSHPVKTRPVSIAVQKRLLPWFLKNARDLPWRKNRTPYRVWVSELMLQQTRVEQAIPYYRRWMKKFPSLAALARAPQADVLKCWEGLGYYARARNLHHAAQLVKNDCGGRRLPRTAEELRKLPGVGPYTAAAVASLAFDEDVAVVDGNVIRVLSRLFAYGGDPKSSVGKKKMQAWADALLVKGRAGEFNEAMMELGALICVPVAPKCADCPMQKVCAALAKGMPDKYPVIKKKKKVPHITVGLLQ